MFGLLRVFRGLFGLVFALQVMQLLPVLTWFQELDAVTGNMWAQVLFKVIALVVSGALFVWLRQIINHLHVNQFGEPHPSLADKKWTL